MIEFDIVKVKYCEIRAFYENNSRVEKLNEEEVYLATDNTCKKWIDWVDSGKIMVKNLEEGQKVFFMSDVTFPKRKFTKAFPKNKIVNSIDKCDVIIYNNKNLKNKLNNYSWMYTYHINDKNRWYKYISSGFVSVKTERASYYQIPTSLINDLDGLTNCNKPFLDISDLVLPSDNFLEKESFTKINSLLKSNNSELISLGMNLLTSYNYTVDKFKISMLLRLNKYNLNRIGYKKNIEIKTLLSKNANDYPDNNDDHQYWVKLACDHPEDEIVQEQFRNFARLRWGLDKDVKVSYEN